MIQHAKRLLRGLRRYGEHVLEPVRPVRNLLAHELFNAILHASMPVEAKAEDISIESVFCRSVAYSVADVNDAL